jgi:iron complex transport system ATP-binding protein
MEHNVNLPADTAPLLAAEDLVVGYRASGRTSKAIAGPFALTLCPGELVCLLGPNGAGKSTLMRTLAGLQPPLAGRLDLGGTPLADLGAGARARQLSIVLTDRVEASGLSVLELVRLGRHPHTGWLGGLSAHDDAQVQAALVATGTEVFAPRPVGELSDGERQKVLLARALAQDTPVVLLDEPTAHLDLPNRTVWPAKRARPFCSRPTSSTWRCKPPTASGCCPPMAACTPALPKTLCSAVRLPPRLPAMG